MQTRDGCRNPALAKKNGAGNAGPAGAAMKVNLRYQKIAPSRTYLSASWRIARSANWRTLAG